MSWLRVSSAAARDATGGRSASVRRADRAVASWSQLPLAAGFVVADESRRRDHSRGRPAAGGVANARSAGGGDGRVPAAAALAVFLQRLPWLLFGLYAGVLADRLDRR